MENKKFLEQLKSSLVDGEKNEVVDLINNIHKKADGTPIDKNKVNIEKELDELIINNEMNPKLKKIVDKYNSLMEMIMIFDDTNLSDEEFRVFNEIKDLIVK
jgi:hypothetical protein